MGNWRTLNPGIIEHCITFLKRGRTRNSDSEQRSYDQLKLLELTRYDFQFEVISNFFLVLTFVGSKGFKVLIFAHAYVRL
jgi:hypothetical protein